MKNKKINLKKNKKSQIFSTLIVIFVFFICCWAFYLHLTNKPKIEKEIVTPLSILNLYDQASIVEQNSFYEFRDSIYNLYAKFINDKSFVSSSCQISQDSFIILNNNCKILNEADALFMAELNSYFKAKNSDLYISSISNDKLMVESKEQTLNLEDKKTLFNFNAKYTFKPKLEYSLENLYLASFSRIKSAVENCKNKPTTDEISSCLSSELPEMLPEVTKEASNIRIILKTKLNLLIDNNFIKPEIKLQI